MSISKAPKIAVLLTGSELLDGRVRDTNACFIGESLNQYGVVLSEVHICGDRIVDIVEMLRLIERRAEYLIISGGLGPTSDDLTREAVADFFGCKLVEDCAVLAAMQENYKKRGRVLDSSNLKQALRPEIAAPLFNSLGTAAGFSVKKERRLKIWSLPGVPRELEAMYSESVLPELIKDLSSQAAVRERRVSFKTFGVPESQVGAKVAGIGVPSQVEISYRAHFPSVDVIIKSYNQKINLDELRDNAIKSLGKGYVISFDLNERLEEKLFKILKSKKLTLSLAESCTGGLVGSYLTSVPGVSEVFMGGVVSYSNQAKISQLGVCEKLIARHGAVSAEVASAMAEGARQLFKSDIALSVTGIAGPEGGSKEKPVGTFFLGYADKDGAKSENYLYIDVRERIRVYAAHATLFNAVKIVGR
jgi:nicotinamide-nucleotide amidase